MYYILTAPSSYFFYGEGKGLFLSNGERPNPFPEHKLLNGEVEINLSSKQSYGAYIPNKPKSSISGKKKHVVKVNVKRERKDLSKCGIYGWRITVKHTYHSNHFPTWKVEEEENSYYLPEKPSVGHS